MPGGTRVNSASRAALLEQARRGGWYHTMELAPGFVTDGVFDLRPYVDRYRIPDRLDGMRAIDVGTFNGFWAFELERRGADVVALDVADEEQIDWPAHRLPRDAGDAAVGEGFRLAHELLGSSVERVETSVYDAFAADLGTFDLVFCGSMVIHLRDQFLAFERMAGLCAPGGRLISAEAYDPLVSLLPFAAARYRAHRDKSPVFWEPGARTWGLMIEAAGFDSVRRVGRFRMRSRRGFSVHHVVHHASR